jgi:hypothetical protein
MCNTSYILLAGWRMFASVVGKALIRRLSVLAAAVHRDQWSIYSANVRTNEGWEGLYIYAKLDTANSVDVVPKINLITSMYVQQFPHTVLDINVRIHAS